MNHSATGKESFSREAIAAIAQARDVRAAIRSGAISGPTSALGPGVVQGNLLILPQEWSDEFLRYCLRNPKPCPLLAVSEPGDPSVPALGDDIDIRTDLPGYLVFRDGQIVAEVNDIRDLWRDDFVSFVIGCSFSFETALVEAGIPLRHYEAGKNVAMYCSSIQTIPSGRFSGPMVVSMRPMTAANAIRAVEITSRFPKVHGAPVHLGDPRAIGIDDIGKPDFGDSVEILPGEIPVFWACGVTPQIAIRAACPSIAISHKPGSMLITDRLNATLAMS